MEALALPGAGKRTTGLRALRREVPRRRRFFYAEEHPPHSPDECPRRMGYDGPCPYVSCRHHLYLDVTEYGGMTICRPDMEPLDLADTCVIDVARRGPLTLDDVGVILGIGLHRVEQIVEEAIAKLAAEVDDLNMFVDQWEEYEAGERRGGYLETGRVSDFVLRGERDTGGEEGSEEVAP